MVSKWGLNHNEAAKNPLFGPYGSVQLFIHWKPGLGYLRGANYSQAGGWTTGYPLITPGSSRGVPGKHVV